MEREMTAPIEDVSSLPGRKLRDQQKVPIGKVKEIYAMDDGFPMWIAVETKAGAMADEVTKFVPLVRLKDEQGELRVPYSKDHVLNAPDIDEGDALSEDADQKLRGYYGIGTGDQELWSDNKGYAAVAPEEGGAAQRVEDSDQLETPDFDRRTDETRERVQNPGSAEPRKATAGQVFGGVSEGDSAEGKQDDGEGKQEDGEGSG
jgi:hypothetical protein